MVIAPRQFAPGARILARDAEWLVRRVDRTSTGGQALTVVGISEPVKDKESLFLTEVERTIETLDPAATRLVPDPSGNYRVSLLYMESLLRQTPPTDERLYIGQHAVMDTVPYQLDPAVQALRQPRQRILIADAVGLGKTLEAGVLVAELIRRGRGKRILVATVKSMLTQFQKEFWNRFTIPLTRLDSIGLQRIRTRIPTNHNPFYYYDKAIISIDTLKQDAEYRVYLENAYWDIIVIDEAHNVAERGHGASLRARLARLLANRSDTLIMLSATPHDGRARSFASLMNMLDPTAIANPDEYTREDIKGLFIRRFKKDIQDQVQSAFKERRISVARATASVAEENAYLELAELRFQRLDQRVSAGALFKTTLEKALFSSPAACLATIKNRVQRLERSGDPEYAADIAALRSLAQCLEGIDAEGFGKYQKLLEVIRKQFGWTGADTDDRLVIFTERIETLRFLERGLPADLKLKPEKVCVLYGELSDIEQQAVVEDFGRRDARVRLLIASDVASEGINLHYRSYRMIHFDIPWSLMVFQQRNGRIDRYGQANTPDIVYLMTESRNDKIRGDTRILELLIEKDEQAVKNIGDPAALMGVYDIDAEEQITARAIEAGRSAADFDTELSAAPFDPLALFLGEAPAAEPAAEAREAALPSLFADDYAYLAAALDELRQHRDLQVSLHPEAQEVELIAPPNLEQRFRRLPREIWPEHGVFRLSADRRLIQDEIERSRQDERAWPAMHYLWPLHPVLDWVGDQVLAAFGRHEAPVLDLGEILAPGEVCMVISGLIPNRKSHPLIHRWFGVCFRDGVFRDIEPLPDLLERTGLHRRRLPNREAALDVAKLEALLPEAVGQARHWMDGQWREFSAEVDIRLAEQLAALKRLRDKQQRQLDLELTNSRQPEKLLRTRREQRQRAIDSVFDEYQSWIEDTLSTENNPYLQVVAVLYGGPRI